MDILTHMLISYAVNYYHGDPNNPQYLLFGVFMGIFPDFDIFLFPLSRRFFWAKHHGAMHSFFGMGVIVLVSACIYSHVEKLDFVLMSTAGIISAYLHIICDSLTSYSCPLLWPFSKKNVKYEIDRPINPYLMLYSSLSIIFLFYLHKIQMELQQYLTIFYGVILTFAFYLIFRFSIKVYITKITLPKHHTTPTVSPFVWNVVSLVKKNDYVKVEYGRYNVFKGKILGKVVNKYCTSFTEPPINENNVIQYSYNLPEVQRYISQFKYPVCSIISQNNDKWTLFWYAVEMLFTYGAPGIIVEIEANGKHKSKSGFMRVS